MRLTGSEEEEDEEEDEDSTACSVPGAAAAAATASSRTLAREAIMCIFVGTKGRHLLWVERCGLDLATLDTRAPRLGGV